MKNFLQNNSNKIFTILLTTYTLFILTVVTIACA